MFRHSLQNKETVKQWNSFLCSNNITWEIRSSVIFVVLKMYNSLNLVKPFFEVNIKMSLKDPHKLDFYEK